MSSLKITPTEAVTNGKLKNEDKRELDPGEGAERGTWDNQCEFFLSCLGYAVGFGNVWRFPFLCYKNGGAAFLIPYTIMLFCAGLPLFFMELALGQYISLGPNILFPHLAPIMSGLGWAMLVISALACIYYNMILAWVLFYTFASFTSELPWSNCDNYFNTIGCTTDEEARNCSGQNLVYYNKTCHGVDYLCNLFNATSFNSTHCERRDDLVVKRVEKIIGRLSASEDYFKNRMLQVTDTTWENMGGMQWELAGCLALAWIIVGLCLIKGVKSSGKVVYFTALFPYVVLLILFVRGVLLEGSGLGIRFYFTEVDWESLKKVTVWNDAATQIFYSLGPSFGGLITLASYNKFKNNCMRDAIVIALANCSTSIFAGFVIFSILGFMATELGVPIHEVVSSGSGLAFIAYPAAITKMPVPTLWSILFFFMLITLGLDSQFTMVETLTTAIFDQFQWLRPKKPLVVSLMSLALFLCGLTMCLQGGIYMFELFNTYCAALSLVIVAFIEIVAVQYIYGFDRFMSNIRNGIGVRMPAVLYYYWKVTWLFLTPLSLIIIFAFSCYFWVPLDFGGYVFPENIQGLGWAICWCSVAMIPIFGFLAIYRNRVNKENWKDLFRTTEDFCPAHERRLLKQKGAALKGEPIGMFRYTYDNEGFQEGSARIYPPIGLGGADNAAFQQDGKLKERNKGDDSEPPPYSNYM